MSGSETRKQSSVWRLVAPIRGRLIAACGVQALASVAGLVPFIAVVEITRALWVAEDPGAALTWAGIAAGALALRLICIMLAATLTHFADADLQLDLRRQMAARLSKAPLSWFTKTNSGALKKGVQDDFTAFHDIVGHAFTMIVGAACVPIGVLIYLAYVDWRLPLAALVPVAIGGGLMASQMRGQGEKMKEYDAAMARVNAAAVEYVSGIGVIKTFSGTGRAFDRFLERGNAFFDDFWNWVKEVLTVSALMELTLSPPAAITFASGLALLLSSQGIFAPIEGFALVALAPLLTQPFMALAFAQHNFQQAAQAGDRLSALLDTPVLPQPDNETELAGYGVVFENVTASYDGHRDVLRDINLVLEPGTTTALVGPSGSGKSTIARLLPRFLDPKSGTVSIGGVPVTMLPAEQLYRSLGFVFQDVRLLRGSIRDNLAIGAPNADFAEITAATRLAHIHDRIAALPRGYDSEIGKDAILSGGEAQRLTIARALLADPPILVLDEALAFADAETAAALRTALAQWSGNRTLLVVAHDLTSITHADQICVLEEGRIVACGSHSELLATEGLYARLWAATEREEAA
ncbi:MAG: ABC transporter ATP-binding protein [Pseudomonadota bacterium]